jgi:oxygen-independent coproporphyrinogen-3 oxidase
VDWHALVLAGHDETIVPANKRFSTFFARLDAEGAGVETLSGEVTKAALAGKRCVIVGDPARALSADEESALASWIDGGGHMLAVLMRAPLLGWKPCGKVRSWLRPRVRVHDPAVGRFDYMGGQYLDGPAPSAAMTHRGQVVVARQHRGKGSITVLGATSPLEVFALARKGQLVKWLLAPILAANVPLELAERMEKPQRHRLLHGYPMAPLMRKTEGTPRFVERLLGQIHRLQPGLTVGVLPHPFCNPAVKGCGFCTFPHQDYAKQKAEEVVAAVVREIDTSPLIEERRRVEALYFGGATANLTPPEGFKSLLAKLRERFDLSQAEVTLEGVPIYFTSRKPSLLEMLKAELPARHYRISMGVQTFDPEQIARMGRTAFGDRAAIEKVVAYAKELGCTVSGDFLFNLPGQTIERMRADLDAAVAMGFDQVCLYHLVLAPELGTEWAKDATLLSALPANEAACAHSIELRERILANGYVQATLTNFERKDVHESERRFRYEACGFEPESFETLGFGPSGLSLVRNDTRWSSIAEAVKLMNPEGADDYLAAIARGEPAERAFVFDGTDWEVLGITRKIARLRVPRDLLRGREPELDALEKAGLVTLTNTEMALTPRGMFYADSIAGLFAARRVRELQSNRRERDLNRAFVARMG